MLDAIDLITIIGFMIMIFELGYKLGAAHNKSKNEEHKKSRPTQRIRLFFS